MYNMHVSGNTLIGMRRVKKEATRYKSGIWMDIFGLENWFYNQKKKKNTSGRSILYGRFLWTHIDVRLIMGGQDPTICDYGRRSYILIQYPYYYNIKLCTRLVEYDINSMLELGIKRNTMCLDNVHRTRYSLILPKWIHPLAFPIIKSNLVIMYETNTQNR